MKKQTRNRTLSVFVLASSFALAAMVAVLTGADPASAKRLGYDSVDGGEIRYEINSRFGSEIRFAAAQWNKVGRIAIRQGGPGTDLEFDDYSRSDGLLAYYQLRSRVDLINFNLPQMNKIGASGKRWTAVHELGHALGLDHAPKKVKKRAVMYQFCCPSFDTPQEHDKKVYRQIWGGGKSGAKQEPARAATSDVAPPVIRPVYAFDATNDRKLVGRATNVFVGRVIEESGSGGATLSDSGENSVPQTQFSVEVLNSVKGDLGGTVTVSQLGGIDEEEGREVLLEDDSLLEPGREYLFSTNYDEETGWYTVVAQPFGAVPVESEEQRARTEERFARAEAAQLP